MGRGVRLPALGAEFRSIAVAEGASVVGDQLAKIAVVVLVFQQTQSATWTAAAFAAVFVPDLVAGPTLSPLADRFPRRTVMVWSAVGQAVIAAAIAVPGVHPGVVIVAVAAIAVLTAPYRAAQAGLLRSILGESVKRGQVQLSTMREGGQLAGLAAAGTVVAVLSPSAALLVDAGTFLIAAVAVRFGVRARPVPERVSSGTVLSAGWRAVTADRRLIVLTLLVTANAVAIVPDAVMPAYAAEVGAPEWVIGPLMAADVVGYLLGTMVLRRVSPPVQTMLIGPLAVLALAPLPLFFLGPPPIAAAVLLVVSGAGSSYLPLVAGEVLQLVRDDVAGSVSGLIRTGMRAGQGVGAVVGGLLSDTLRSASAAIAVTGVAGVLAAAVGARSWHLCHLRANEAVT